MGIAKTGCQQGMTGPRVTLLRSQERDLSQWLSTHPDGHERGAILLFRRLDRLDGILMDSARFLLIESVFMDGDWVLDSSATSLRINLRKFPEIYYRCETEGLELGFAHSHPNGFLGFSSQDDTNEVNIMHGLSGCNGTDSHLVAMVTTGDKWIARVRQGTNHSVSEKARHVAILGDNLSLQLGNEAGNSSDVLARQEAAFGKPFNDKIGSLRVCVVGAGGVGSPLITLLIRMGVKELIVIDGDELERSNLNRVRGYSAADIGKNKAEAIATYIDNIGLEARVLPIACHLGESGATIDALSSADVVFGCTDDLAGRELISQAVYYYGLVYIDSGLTGKVDIGEDGEPYLRDHRGRISRILPESGACLRCQRVVTNEKLKYEQAIKDRPELAELDPEVLQVEYYLTGGGEQAPGVGPFTSATADIALSTLMDLIKPFRNLPSDLRSDNIWHDFVHLSIHSNEPKNDPSCIYCRQGVMLLKKEEDFRLDMPKLGKF